MKFIPFSINSGEINMQIDAQLLGDAILCSEKEPILRLYGWSPASISLGRNQSDEFLDRDFLQKNGIDVVRRLTGGRALLHDDEITYSFICPQSYLKNGEHIVSSYKEICEILISAFKKLSIDLDFGTSKQIRTGFNYCMLLSTGADLCYKGKKLIGSAQCRKNGYILQHGSILYDYDKSLTDKIFQEDVDVNSITTVKEINPNE